MFYYWKIWTINFKQIAQGLCVYVLNVCCFLPFYKFPSLFLSVEAVGGGAHILKFHKGAQAAVHKAGRLFFSALLSAALSNTPQPWVNMAE